MSRRYSTVRLFANTRPVVLSFDKLLIPLIIGGRQGEARPNHRRAERRTLSPLTVQN